MGCVSSTQQYKTDVELEEILPPLRKEFVPPEVLTRQEFIQKPNIEKLNKQFQQVDEGKENQVDIDQLKTLAENYGIECSYDIIQNILQVIYQDEGKKVDERDSYQIIYILMNIGKSYAKERILFLNADKDFSGAIDFTEFQYILKQIDRDMGLTKNKEIFGDMCKHGEEVSEYHVFCYTLDKIKSQ